MKKEYEVPKAEKLEFDYSEGITASNGCGGIYQKFTEATSGCNTKPGEWFLPFSDTAGPLGSAN